MMLYHVRDIRAPRRRMSEARKLLRRRSARPRRRRCSPAPTISCSTTISRRSTTRSGSATSPRMPARHGLQYLGDAGRGPRERAGSGTARRFRPHARLSPIAPLSRRCRARPRPGAGAYVAVPVLGGRRAGRIRSAPHCATRGRFPCHMPNSSTTRRISRTPCSRCGRRASSTFTFRLPLRGDGHRASPRDASGPLSGGPLALRHERLPSPGGARRRGSGAARAARRTAPAALAADRVVRANGLT